MAIRVAFLLLALAATSHATRYINNPIRLVSDGADQLVDDCGSWRLAVETNNFRDWKVVPRECKDYVARYMLHGQYARDCEVVAGVGIEHANGLNISGNGKQVWIFDIDETALSNLRYYARDTVQFGALPFNRTAFYEWVEEEKALPVPAILRLYNHVISLGLKVVFLSGTREVLREARVNNLRTAGYHTWEKLLMKADNETAGAIEYSSKRRTELVEEGYEIVGNIGDQWTDLLGENVGNRTFKVPNPMYYVSAN